MPRKKIPAPERILTDVELELMTLVWSLGKPAAVKDVAALLPASRRLAYTTVATVMKILEQKAFLVCRKDAHAHTFEPLISKTDYEQTCIDHVVSNVFDGEPLALVQRLLDARRLSPDELRAIETKIRMLGDGAEADDRTSKDGATSIATPKGRGRRT